MSFLVLCSGLLLWVGASCIGLTSLFKNNDYYYDYHYHDMLVILMKYSSRLKVHE